MMNILVLESKQLVRSKWLQIVTALFVIVFTAILMIQQLALPNAEGFTRQSAALLNILLFLLPLFMLTIGAMSIAADIESGWFYLLKTYPMKTGLYVFVKWASQFLVFSGIAVLAMSIALLLGSFFGGVSISKPFILVTILLIFLFTSFSVFVGSLAKNRLHALAIGLGVWSLLSLVLSYVIMAVGTLIAEHLLKDVIVLHIHINPLEWIRFSYFLLADQTAVLGPAFYDIVTFYHSTIGMLYFSLFSMLWVLCPLLLATYILKKRGQ